MSENAINTVDSMLDAIAQTANDFVRDNSIEVPTSNLPIDNRSAPTVFVGKDFIAVKSAHVRTFEYYGGFEYVPREYVHRFGSYVIYINDRDSAGDCERIEQIIDASYDYIDGQFAK